MTGPDSHPTPPLAILALPNDLGAKPMPAKHWDEMTPDERIHTLRKGVEAMAGELRDAIQAIHRRLALLEAEAAKSHTDKN